MLSNRSDSARYFPKAEDLPDWGGGAFRWEAQRGGAGETKSEKLTNQFINRLIQRFGGEA